VPSHGTANTKVNDNHSHALAASSLEKKTARSIRATERACPNGVSPEIPLRFVDVPSRGRPHIEPRGKTANAAALSLCIAEYPVTAL
jgi:hypothetical protein